LITRKAEGNPFFVEEVVRSLEEAGAIRREGDRLVLGRRLDEIVVPDTVEDVIQARLDRLDDGPRRILQVASVIGREFSRRLLDRLADLPEQDEQHLRELRAVELISEKSLSPELAYTFRHALTREVAYGSLAAERRRELHGLVGSAIEDLFAGRLAEHYEILAHHFSRAEEWPKAFAYLLKAADKAAQAFAVHQALALYDDALVVAGRRPEAVDHATAIAIHRARCTLYFVVSDFGRSRAEAETLLALAREAGDRETEAEALAGIAWAATWARDLPGAVANARQAIDVAAPSGNTKVLGRAHLTVGFVRGVTGGLEEARGATDLALAASEAAGDDTQFSLALSVSGLLKSWEGDFEAAARAQAQGLAIARDGNLLVPLLFSFFLYGLTLTGKGDYDDALALFDEGLGLAEKLGDEAIHHRLLNCLGWLHAEVGDLEHARALNERSAEIGRRRRDPGTLPNAQLNLGDILLATGDLSEARDRFDEVQGLARDSAQSEWMKWRYSIHLHASLGEWWLARGDLVTALDCANRCRELAARTRSRKNLAKGWRLAGEIARARRRWDEAEACFREALAIAGAVGNPTQIWRTHLALGRCREDAGRTDAARRSYRAAREVVDRVRVGLRDARLRGAFERAALVRQVLDLGAPR
jgi:tetratricopeptide (TPR) repeat protein